MLVLRKVAFWERAGPFFVRSEKNVSLRPMGTLVKRLYTCCSLLVCLYAICPGGEATQEAADKELFSACRKGDMVLFGKAINKKANIDCWEEGYGGSTPMHIAVQRGNVKIFIALLLLGGELDPQKNAPKKAPWTTLKEAKRWEKSALGNKSGWGQIINFLELFPRIANQMTPEPQEEAVAARIRTVIRVLCSGQSEIRWAVSPGPSEEEMIQDLIPFRPQEKQYNKVQTYVKKLRLLEDSPAPIQEDPAGNQEEKKEDDSQKQEPKKKKKKPSKGKPPAVKKQASAFPAKGWWILRHKGKLLLALFFLPVVLLVVEALLELFEEGLYAEVEDLEEDPPARGGAPQAGTQRVPAPEQNASAAPGEEGELAHQEE